MNVDTNQCSELAMPAPITAVKTLPDGGALIGLHNGNIVTVNQDMRIVDTRYLKGAPVSHIDLDKSEKHIIACCGANVFVYDNVPIVSKLNSIDF